MHITTQIQGGLGNQLFQYATGKAISLRLKRPLHVDVDWFRQGHEGVTPRNLLLPYLNLKYEIDKVSSVFKPPKRWQRIAQRILPTNTYVLNDRPYRFNVSVNQFNPFRNQSVYLMGYWQSYRYFESIRNELLEEIKPAKPLSSNYQAYLEDIHNASSAMVHIRRGDYIHLPAAAKIHGFLGLEYYKKGMDLLLEADAKTKFFVFSDDIDWAKKNLPHQDQICFIESIEEESAPVQELFLMSQCQKHLIANSSLSWWGAWLSTSSSSHTVAPKKWTNDLNRNWEDLLLPQWQRI